jgi:hypothetical protein
MGKKKKEKNNWPSTTKNSTDNSRTAQWKSTIQILANTQ